MTQKLLSPLIWLVIIVIVLFTLYNINRNISVDRSSEPYVIDMLKIDAAQKLKVSKILGNAVTSGDYYDAFKASGSVMAAAKEVSGGRPVVIKQAYLIESYLDITDRVIEAMGLPNPGNSYQVLERLIPEPSEVPNAKLGNAVSNNRDVGLPY